MADDFSTYSDQFIQIFQFSRSTDQAVDQWAAAIEAYIEQMPKSEPFYILLDVSADGVDFTAHARQHSKRLFTKFKDRQGYVAMLFAWRTSPYFARLFFSSLGRLGFKRNFFHNRSQATAWLHEMYKGDISE
jgi:hypothetical protein